MRSGFPRRSRKTGRWSGPSGASSEVTDELQGQPFERNAAPQSGAGTSFSVRQVAHVLGLAEATLKRMPNRAA